METVWFAIVSAMLETNKRAPRFRATWLRILSVEAYLSPKPFVSWSFGAPQTPGSLCPMNSVMRSTFSPNELVARVRALLRRAARETKKTAAKTLAYGSIAVDTERHIVSSGGDAVTLTAKEFLLLEYMLQHRGRVLSRDLLLTDVWGYRYTGGTRTVDVHVRRLREKLPALADALVTIKQFGYKLLDPAP